MLSLALMLVAGVQAGPALSQSDVAYEELSNDRNKAAIAKIEANTAVDAEHPARLINLGIAFAREGRFDEAEECFAGVFDSERVQMETATGNWVDSHVLARRAIAELDRGAFGPQRLANR